jgi:hypothetical protein
LCARPIDVDIIIMQSPTREALLLRAEDVLYNSGMPTPSGNGHLYANLTYGDVENLLGALNLAAVSHGGTHSMSVKAELGFLVADVWGGEAWPADDASAKKQGDKFYRLIGHLLNPQDNAEVATNQRKRVVQPRVAAPAHQPREVAALGPPDLAVQLAAAEHMIGQLQNDRAILNTTRESERAANRQREAALAGDLGAARTESQQAASDALAQAHAAAPPASSHLSRVSGLGSLYGVVQSDACVCSPLCHGGLSLFLSLSLPHAP